MHLIDTPDAVASQFTDGDPMIPTPATEVDDDWLNAIQNELANVAQMDGAALVKGTNTQVRKVLSDRTAAIIPGGRLSLSLTESAPQADQTGAATVNYVPHAHGFIPVVDPATGLWRLAYSTALVNTLSDATKNPAAAALDSVYDLFVWLDSGTLRLGRGPAWSSSVSRGTGPGTTEIVRSSGRWVNKYAITNGAAAQCGLYVGTFHTQATAVAEDSVARRDLWNAYNRVARPLSVQEASATWTSSTASYQLASNSYLSVVIGLPGESVEAEIRASASGTNAFGGVGVGVGSLTVPSGLSNGVGSSGNFDGVAIASYRGAPGIGRFPLYWLQYASGTVTFSGNNGPRTGGMVGSINA